MNTAADSFHERMIDELDAEATEEQLEAVHRLVHRYYESGGGTVPPDHFADLAESMSAWIDREDLWGEIPMPGAFDREKAARNPGYREATDRLTYLLRRRIVVNYFVRLLASAYDDTLRCGDLEGVGVQALHRPGTLKTAW